MLTPREREQSELRNTLKQYGLTLHDYYWMVEEQLGRCAICFKPPPRGKRLVVDHCHTTGKVRGLLCGRCNAGLGMLGDTKVKSALDYISTERHSIQTQQLYSVKSNNRKKTETHTIKTLHNRKLFSVHVSTGKGRAEYERIHNPRPTPFPTMVRELPAEITDVTRAILRERSAERAARRKG